MFIVYPDSVTIQRASVTTSTDGYNSKVRTWESPTSTPVDAHVQPVTTSELLESERGQVVTRYKVFLPAGTSVRATDRLLWGSLLLAVDGEPRLWHDFFGTPDHIELLAVVSAG